MALTVKAQLRKHSDDSAPISGIDFPCTDRLTMTYIDAEEAACPSLLLNLAPTGCFLLPLSLRPSNTN